MMPKILEEGSFFICTNKVSKADLNADRVSECLYQVMPHATDTVINLITQNIASYEIYGDRPFKIEQQWLDNREIKPVSETEANAYKSLHELIIKLLGHGRAHMRASGFCKFESDELKVIPSYSRLYIGKFKAPITVDLPDGTVISSSHITDLGELITSIKGNGLKTIKLADLPIEVVSNISLEIRNVGYAPEVEKKLQPRPTSRRRGAE